MMVEIDFWKAATLLLSLTALLAGAFWGLGRVLVNQYDRMLTERFKARDEADSSRAKQHDAELGKLSNRLAKYEDSQRVQAEELRQADSELSEKVGKRLIELEKAVAAAPSKEDLVRLHKRIDDVAGEISELSGAFQGAADTLKLIHSKLLGGKS